MVLDLDNIDGEAPRGEVLAGLAWRLCSVQSVSDDEREIADGIEAFLRRINHLKVLRDGDTVVARTHRGRGTRVILAGHIDTVPVLGNFPPQWLEPGDARINPNVAASHPGERVLWGRGGVDMKGSDAVLLYVAAMMESPRFDVTYVFYDHEEVAGGRNGLGRVFAHHPDWLAGDFAVIGEPTACGIEGGCNGSLRFDVITHGVAAHSSRPWLGDNAIHKAGAVLELLSVYRPAVVTVDGLQYPEALNATLISGGKATNIIPDECRVHVNYRFAPDKTVAEAKAAMFGADCPAAMGSGECRATGGVFAGYDVEMADESPAARPGLDDPRIAELVDFVRRRTGRAPAAKLGWTDAARFSAHGIPAVNLGAGDPNLAHKPDEQLPVGDLDTLASILADWLS